MQYSAVNLANVPVIQPTFPNKQLSGVGLKEDFVIIREDYLKMISRHSFARFALLTE